MNGSLGPNTPALLAASLFQEAGYLLGPLPTDSCPDGGGSEERRSPWKWLSVRHDKGAESFHKSTGFFLKKDVALIC